MTDTDNKKTNAQKLAETLKRCGLASSVTQAHKMAGDITLTEKKVQTFFDKRKEELRDEMYRKLHGNREEFLEAKKEEQKKQEQKDYRQDVFKEMLERTKSPEAVKVQVYYDTPLKHEAPQSPIIEEKKHEEPVNIPNDDMLKSDKPLKEILEGEVREKEDYLNQFTKIEEKKLDEAEPLGKTQGVSAVEKEEKIQVQKVHEEKPKFEIPPKPPHPPTAMGPHPKTGTAQSFDLLNYFNFGKKGKI